MRVFFENAAQLIARSPRELGELASVGALQLVYPYGGRRLAGCRVARILLFRQLTEI